MKERDLESSPSCPHCGAENAHHLGMCSVCQMNVCERCGNTQHVHGERRVTHNTCLSQDTGFTMFRFVG